MSCDPNRRSASRLASVVWAILVPVASLGAAAAFMAIPPNTHGVDLAAGRDLFRAHCGACHFAKMGFPAHHGPNLHDIGRIGAGRRPQRTAPEYILESILDPAAVVAPGSRPGMPNNLAAQLAPEEIRNIIGFLANCGASADYRHIRNLKISDQRTPQSPTIRVERTQMSLAQQVLREKGHCLQCHSLYSHPGDGIFAPALFGVGLTNREQVRKSIVEPSHEVNERYGCVSMELKDGTVLSGQVLHRGAGHVVLCQRDEQGEPCQRVVQFAEIESDDGDLLIYPLKTSLMPVGFDQVLTAEEIQAIEVLIRQLN